MKPLTVECVCHSDEHIIRFFYDDEDGYVYMTFHLKNHSWYSRVWYAIKHIFGHKSKYGCFDEIVVDKETAAGIINFLQKGVMKYGQTEDKKAEHISQVADKSQST